MVKENTHCRKPDCKYHPDRYFGLFHIFWLRCLKCKHFVSRNNYISNEKD